MGHLGYPASLMTILGVWYMLAGPALLVPRFARLKEWAYAGLVFTYTGAAASRLAVGDGAETLVAPIIFTGLTAASWALRPSARRDLAPSSAASSRSRTIAYWITTVIIALEMAIGGVWDILRISYVRTVMEHLGYPIFFLVILGVWKIPCAVTLLAPRFPRLKEWAYAGAIFNYTGAVASHVAVGDGASQWAAPLVFAALTLASWALRPSSRRLDHSI
jgi:DoxX-like family